MGNTESDNSSVLIILILSISIIGSAGITSGEDSYQEGGTRGVIFPPAMARIDPGELILQPGENATCDVILNIVAYSPFDMRIWLEGVPRIMNATLDITNFNHIYNVDEVHTSLKVSIPEDSPVNAGIILVLHGSMTEGNYTWRFRPAQLWVIIKGPDLSINNSAINFSLDKPREGQNVDITVSITNIGEVEAYNISVKFFIDDGPIGDIKVIDRLAPGDSYNLSETWTATSGDHIVFVKIDSEDSIREYSEHNNCAITNISVAEKQSYSDYCFSLIITLGVTILGVKRIITGDKK